MQRQLVGMLAVVATGVTLASAARAQEAAATGKQETEIVGGLSLNDGNSENTQLHAGIATKGTYGPNEIKAGAQYAYGESTVENADGTSTESTTTDNAKADAQYNRLFTDATYGFASASWLRDDLADIDYRVVIGVGLGHYLVKSDKATFAIEAGPAQLFEKVADEDHDALLLRLAERAEYVFARGAKVWESVEYLPELEDFDAYLLNAEVGLDASVVGDLSLRLAVVDRYDSEPAPGREENDISVTAGLVYKL